MKNDMKQSSIYVRESNLNQFLRFLDDMGIRVNNVYLPVDGIGSPRVDVMCLPVELKCIKNYFNQ